MATLFSLFLAYCSHSYISHSLYLYLSFSFFFFFNVVNTSAIIDFVVVLSSHSVV